MSSSARRYRLGNSRRIRDIFRIGLRAHDRCASMVVLANGLDYPRIAYAVGRRAHGNAVRRNRVKRLCREGFLRVRDSVPAGLDIVYIPRAGDWHSVEAFAGSILSLARRLASQVGKDGMADAGSRDAPAPDSDGEGGS